MRAILLGGPPLLGKSELASNYTRRVKVDRLIRTDELRNTIRFWSELNHVDAFPYLSIGLFSETVDSQQFAAFFDAQSSEMSAVAEEHIQYYSSRGQSVLVEGTHLLPTIGMPRLPGRSVVQRYVLMTSKPEQYEALAQSRSIERYGADCGPDRFINYRRLWSIYAHALTRCLGSPRVLDAGLGLDVCLQTMLDESVPLRGVDND